MNTYTPPTAEQSRAAWIAWLEGYQAQQVQIPS